MSVRILRWGGGAGGDIILYLKSLCAPDSVVNVKYTALENNGKTGVDFSTTNWATAKNSDKIATIKYLDQVDSDALSAELNDYNALLDQKWFKSHYYNTDLYKDFTIDLVVDDLSLPFAVASNISKTATLDLPFNLLSSKITDPIIKVNYSMYCVAVDFISKQAIGTQQINVSELIKDTTTFDCLIKKHNFDIDSKFYYVYENWLRRNIKNLPSQQYINKVLNKDYDFNDTNLTLSERYSLMALAKQKFTNLTIC
jgi:hypothetical protein